MKNKIVKIITWTFLVFALLVVIVIWQRHTLIVNLYKYSREILKKTDEGNNVKWFDDYYTIQKLDSNVYAIGEPRYWQRNYNYLIIGEDKALLIDAGPGIRDIKPVVKFLTDLPYTLIPTHFHFDHIGNAQTFPRLAIVDLPHLRERAKENIIHLGKNEHLGKPEEIEAPLLHVSKWIEPESSFNLGNRKVKVIYTPGHTIESISLYDIKSNILFTGDWFTKVLVPMASNSNMGDFYMAFENVLCDVPKDARVFGAHKYEDGGGAPELTMQDIKAVKNEVYKIKNGELKATGFFPAFYKLPKGFELYTDITWLQKWTPNYLNLRLKKCD